MTQTENEVKETDYLTVEKLLQEIQDNMAKAKAICKKTNSVQARGNGKF
jgi:hypothetical protein